MTFDYQNLGERDLNQINGSSSALGEGSFKRRDELRRAESLQRNKIKMGERLDRSINRAVRKGDAGAANAFNNLRQAISGQGFGGTGIGSPDDRNERVKDGTLKGADFRHGVGNIGNTAPAEGPIANAPPPVEKPQGGGPAWDSDNSGIPDSIQRPVAGPQTAPEGVQSQPAPPIARTEPGGLTAKLVTKFKKGSIDPVAMQSAYQAEMGDPADQAFNAPPLEPAPKTPVAQKPALVPSQEDIAFGDRVGAATGKVREDVDALGKKIDGSLNDAATRRATYEKNEAERLRKRSEGMAAVDSKLGKELEKADQWGVAQKKMSADYFADLDATESRNKAYTDDLSSANPLRSVPAAFRGGLFDDAVEPSPVMPAPIDYDSFDPSKPPTYTRQLPPKQVYKAPAYIGKGYAGSDMSQRAILYRQSQAQKALKTYTQPPANPIPR